MSVYIDTHMRTWRPPDARTRSQWVYDHVQPPNSARSKRLDVSVTPWLREPIDQSSDNRIKEMVVLMPTGGGKTTLIDGIIPHAITEDPGPILLTLQTDADAREYVEERLMPILRGVPQISHIMAAMDRHAIRRDSVMFPHLPLYMGGASLTHLQRKSCRWVLCDEVWRWKHGYVKEARARTHDRWNSRVLLASQGGWTHLETDAGTMQTELDEAWEASDKREWHFECPHCKTVQRFRLKALRYQTVERADGSLDEAAILQSARYACLGPCGTEFADHVQNRRALAMSGRYIASNPSNMPGKAGWHCNALTLHYLAWGVIAVELAKAHRARKQGDEEMIRIFRQKRMAENYRKEEERPMTALTLGDYAMADYLDGQIWEGEVMRCLLTDVQRDHFFVTARAWKADGSSRRLHCERVNTVEQVRALQHRMKIEDRWCGMDSKYDTDFVYNTCAKYGWLALQGDQAKSFRFDPPRSRAYYKFYSPARKVTGSAGRPCNMMFWSNLQIKRILERLRNGPRRIGDTEETTLVPRWEVERDITQEFQGHLFSEIEKDIISKVTKAITRAFVRIGSRANHTWDTSAMEVVFALAAGVLRGEPEQESKPEA